MGSHEVLTSSAKITCLCGAVSERGSLIAETQFPISDGICICSICRAASGALFAGGVSLKSAPSRVALEACTKYAASKVCSRYHCRKCGSPAFTIHHESNGDEWFVAMGAIDRTDDYKHQVDTFKLTYSIYSDPESNPGGGLLQRIAEVSSPSLQNVECFAVAFEDKPLSLTQAAELWRWQSHPNTGAQSPPPSTQTKSSTVPVSCHCGGVSFTLLPATNHSPNTDEKYVKRWTRSEGTKYVAKFCVCRYDRLVFGVPFAAWTYVFPECILTKTGSPIDFTSNFPSTNDEYFTTLPGFSTLQIYRSTSEAKRTFCRVCGATVFYEHVDRPQIVNVAPGLIRSQSGVLAEDVLSWDWEWVSWPEENENREWLDGITGGKMVTR